MSGFRGEAVLGGEVARLLAERQSVRVVCGNCAEFDVTLPLSEARAAFDSHRLARHPEVVPSMPNPRALALTGVSYKPQQLAA